jgi:small-conductance mechanosensitive channel
MFHGVALASLIVPALLLFAGLGVGLGVRLLLARRLARTRAGAPAARHLLLNAARGSAVLWFGTLGLYVAAEAADLPPRISGLVRHALLVMLIASVSWTLSRVAGGLVRSHAAVGALPSATVITNLSRGLVLLLGLLVALQTLGVSITPMITALGVSGLAVALALQDTLANLFAGLHILLSRQVHTGDLVRLDSGQEGIVQDVTWRYTTLRQPGSGLLVVPNAKLAAAITTNFTRPDTQLAVKVGVRVTYDVDPDQVERIAADVAREVLRDVDGGVAGEDPKIRFQKLGMATIEFTAELTAKDAASQGLVRHEFIKRLLRRFRAEGIELPGGAFDPQRAERVGFAAAPQQGVI